MQFSLYLQPRWLKSIKLLNCFSAFPHCVDVLMVRSKLVICDFLLDQGRHHPDPRDPRSLGQGPCSALDSGHNVQKEWSSSQYGVWKRCERCALRFQYHPHKNATGEFRTAGPTPELAMRAFQLGADVPAAAWAAKAFDGYLKIAEGERRTGRRANMAPTGAAPSTGPQPQTPPGPGSGGNGASGRGPGGETSPPWQPPPEDDDDMIHRTAWESASGGRGSATDRSGTTQGATQNASDHGQSGMPSAEVSPEEKELQDVLNISVATAEAEETQRRLEELRRLEESHVWEVVPSDNEAQDDHMLVFYDTKARPEEETTAASSKDTKERAEDETTAASSKEPPPSPVRSPLKPPRAEVPPKQTHYGLSKAPAEWQTVLTNAMGPQRKDPPPDGPKGRSVAQ